MEKENAYKQFSALESEEYRLYDQYRDSVDDYTRDVAGLTEEYKTALEQENKDRDYNYQKQRDAISDSRFNEELAYKKSRDAVTDARANDDLAYKYSRAAIEDAQWQKNFELQQLQYQNALSKARSGGSSRRSRSSNTTDDTYENSKSWTDRDANKILTQLAVMTKSQAQKFIKDLVNSKEAISRAEANYLWQKYLEEVDYDETEKEHSTHTTLDMIKNIINVSEDSKILANQKRNNKKK